MLKIGLEVEGMRALIEAQPKGDIVFERLNAWSGAYATELIAPTVMGGMDTGPCASNL